MITARRENNVYDSFKNDRTGVAVLERESVTEVSEKKPSRQESIDEVKERMKKNLAMILNYDKPEAVIDAPVEEEVKAEQSVSEVNDDFCPTTTTMQFGDNDVNEMFNELKKEEQKVSAVSGKTKFALILYAIAVTVILALIIVNTGVLSLINSKSELKQSELYDVMQEYREVNEELNLHGDDYVEKMAEELGMVK